MKGASVLSMDQPRYCRHCGKKLEPGSTHCIYCGAEVAVHISFKGGKRSADSLKAWKRITISLAAITAVLTVIFAGLIWDRFGKNGTVPQDSAEAAPESAPVSEEAAESEAAADPETPSKTNIPEGAFYYGGNYYWVYEHGIAATWEEAEAYCEKLGGHLAVITSGELNDMLYAYIKSKGFKTAFFGYSDAKIDGDWRWVTSAQPSYTNWGRNEPNADDLAEDYALFSTEENNGTWNDSQFGYEVADFICQWGDEGIYDEEIAMKIPDDALKYDGNAYYIYDNGITSWHAAQQYCKSLGGDLAVIYDKEENEQLFNYMVSKGYENAYIGLSNRDTRRVWKWVSGRLSDFTDWGKDEDGYQAPYDDLTYGYYCRFNTELTEGHWDNAKFGNGSYAYICKWTDVK